MADGRNRGILLYSLYFWVNNFQTCSRQCWGLSQDQLHCSLQARGEEEGPQVYRWATYHTFFVIVILLFVIFFMKVRVNYRICKKYSFSKDWFKFNLFVFIILSSTQVDRGDCWFLGHFFLLLLVYFLFFCYEGQL